MHLKVKRLTETATIPTYATAGAGCFDLYADIGGLGCARHTHHQSIVIDTGLAFDIPEGWVMQIFGRSGLAFKEDIRLANCTGIIDSDYRGSLKVKLRRDALEKIGDIKHGDRIAQGMLVRAEQVNFVEVYELSETERGTGGLGSTGA